MMRNEETPAQVQLSVSLGRLLYRIKLLNKCSDEDSMRICSNILEIAMQKVEERLMS
jgi:hypothetical protein